MEEIKLGMVESRFADIVWQNAPMTTKKLVELCKAELDWARTTTYIVLKKLCDRGIFKTENSTVTVLITKDEFNAIQSEQIVEKTLRARYQHLLRRLPHVIILPKRKLKRLRV